MMSASAMSAMIRAKKKKMEEDSGAVKLSGHHMDATDILVIKNKEAGEALSQNKPKEHSDGESLSPESEMDEEMKAQKSAKSAKIKLMMSKMRK